MALKKLDEEARQESLSEKKAKEIFSQKDVREKEKKVLTTFSIEPSFKANLEDMFDDLGLNWAAGVRFALKEFYRNHSDSE